MAFNKDEALKAKQLAEKKLAERDFAGAQEFAVKAHNLFADLDGLTNLLEVINVYVNSRKTINGEVDWYAVLGVDSLADGETLRNHFRSLALALHPDKNNSTGAEGAFRIVCEAWSLLSDSAKRASYDRRRVTMGNAVNWNPLMATGQNIFCKPQKIPSERPPASIIPNIRPTSMPSFLLKHNTFWTKCSWCSMRLEYPRALLYKLISCMSCRSFFWAAEESSPYPPPSSIVLGQRQPFTNYPASSQSNISEGRCFATSQLAMPKLDPWICKYTFNSASNGVPMPSSTATQAESLNTEVNDSKRKRSMDERKLNSERKGRISEMASKSGSSSQANASRNQKVAMGDESVAFHKINKPKGLRNFSQSEMRNMLIGKAMSEIKKKVEEWNVSDVAEKEGSGMEKPTATASAAPGSVKDTMKGNLPLQNKVPTGVDTKAEYVQSMSVPDSDFHDFDKDRMEASFAENQVWAAYDCDDGMPRYYAMIKKVVSKTPFKTCIHWLNSKNNDELGPMKWVVSGFPKTCGGFWIGKSAVNPPLNTFSHKVKWTKGSRGVIQIFPSKGDVWALYSHWSPEWNVSTPDSVVRKYEMVQVLEDYLIENQVARVVPLIKVPGYRSVFKQNSDPTAILSIPKEEIFRLSHQVPSYVITGAEAPNAPGGFLELDPAALPQELLQVITEAKELEDDASAEKLPAEDKPGGEAKKPDENDSRNEAERVDRRFFLTYSRRRRGKKATVKTSVDAEMASA